MTTLQDELAAAPLGHATDYPDTYDAALLFAVPRALQREEIGIGDELPFAGADVWNAYELTWLDPRGKPQVAIASFVVPASSPAIVESKSVKLYLGSFAQSRYADAGAVADAIGRDIGGAVDAPVRVQLIAPADFARQSLAPLAGTSIDAADTDCATWEVDPRLLAAGGEAVAETLTSDLFRSVCPVTGQPDYASVAVAYRGPRIDRAALLRYLVSYRQHAGFHEHCVERIFVDVKSVCRCDALTVHARFTRRGGVDINPYRTDADARVPANVRMPRQ